MVLLDQLKVLSMHETATYGIRTHTHVVATCYRSQLSSWLNSSQLCSSVDQPLHCYWLRACHGERPCAGLCQQPCSLACAFIISSARALASCLVSGLGSACHRYRFSLRPARVMIAAACAAAASAVDSAPAPSQPCPHSIATAPTARNGSLLTSCHHRNRLSPPPP